MPPTERRLWTTERELCRRQGNLCEPALCNSPSSSKGPLWPRQRLSFTVFFSLSQFTKGIAEDLVAKRLVAICRSSNSFLLVFAYPVSNVPIIFALLRRGPPTIPHRHQNSCLFVRHSVALFSCAPYSMYSATGVSFGRTPLAGRLVRSEPPPVLRPRATSACSVQLHRLSRPATLQTGLRTARVVAGAKGGGRGHRRTPCTFCPPHAASLPKLLSVCQEDNRCSLVACIIVQNSQTASIPREAFIRMFRNVVVFKRLMFLLFPL